MGLAIRLVVPCVECGAHVAKTEQKGIGPSCRHEYAAGKAASCFAGSLCPHCAASARSHPIECPQLEDLELLRWW